MTARNESQQFWSRLRSNDLLSENEVYIRLKSALGNYTWYSTVYIGRFWSVHDKVREGRG